MVLLSRDSSKFKERRRNLNLLLFHIHFYIHFYINFYIISIYQSRSILSLHSMSAFLSPLLCLFFYITNFCGLIYFFLRLFFCSICFRFLSLSPTTSAAFYIFFGGRASFSLLPFLFCPFVSFPSVSKSDLCALFFRVFAVSMSFFIDVGKGSYFGDLYERTWPDVILLKKKPSMFLVRLGTFF